MVANVTPVPMLRGGEWLLGPGAVGSHMLMFSYSREMRRGSHKDSYSQSYSLPIGAEERARPLLSQQQCSVPPSWKLPQFLKHRVNGGLVAETHSAVFFLHGSVGQWLKLAHVFTLLSNIHGRGLSAALLIVALGDVAALLPESAAEPQATFPAYLYFMLLFALSV